MSRKVFNGFEEAEIVNLYRFVVACVTGGLSSSTKLDNLNEIFPNLSKWEDVVGEDIKVQSHIESLYENQKPGRNDFRLFVAKRSARSNIVAILRAMYEAVISGALSKHGDDVVASYGVDNRLVIDGKISADKFFSFINLVIKRNN